VRIFPQLALNYETTDLGPFITDDSWVMEQKLDGHRLFLQSNSDGSPAALTRNGTAYTRKLPREITDFRFPAGDYILDGEFVDGVFWAFDMPFGGSDFTGFNVMQRRAALETFLGNIDHPFRIVPRAVTRDQKITLASRALREGFEGLIVKRVDAPYRSAGRMGEWMKIKFVSTIDVVVTDVRADGKDSIGYAVYLDGELKPIGRASLIGKEKNGKIAVGDVVEVRYLYVGADGRLYQPTIVRRRDPSEKRADECNGYELRHVNKAVLEAL